LAKVVLICPKPGAANPYDAAAVDRLARRLGPDIITPLNPLVSRRVVEQVRKLPDRFRDNKNLFIDLVRSISPPIEFARYNAIGHAYGVRKTREIVDEMSRELNGPDARELLSDRLIDLLLAGMEAASVARTTEDKEPRSLKALVPWRIRRWLRATIMKAPVDWNTLASRAYLASRMSAVLTEDAALFANAGRGSAHGPGVDV